MATPTEDMLPDESTGYILITIQSVFLALATALIFIRLYVCQRIMRRIDLGDYFMVMAWVPPSLFEF